MILVDINQLAYACILDHLAQTKQPNASIEMVRHMMLNTLRSNVKKFKQTYGEVIVAYDSDSYWRTKEFPHYKASRKKSRANSIFNWKSIHTCLNELKAELQQHLLYKVLCVEGAEADDIIGHLTQLNAPESKVLIISGDKDFVQLQSFPNVSQYSPLVKKMMVDKFPKITLKQHIIKGDSGDGIPNILSPDDVFVSGGRQKPVMEKKLIGWLNMPVEEFCTTEEMKKNFTRNEKLIDLREIPSEIRTKITEAYDTAQHTNRFGFMQYLATHGLRELTESIGDF